MFYRGKSPNDKETPRSALVPPVPGWLLVLATIVLMSPLTLISMEIAQYFNAQLSPDAWSKFFAEGQRAFDKGEYERAESLLKQALKSAQDASKDQSRALVTLTTLQDLYSVQLKYDQMRAMRDKVTELKTTVGSDETDNQAFKKKLQAVSAEENKAADENLRNLVVQGNELALRQLGAGLPEAGEETLQLTLSAVQNLLGPRNAVVGLAFHNLGNFYLLRHDLERAQPYFAQSVDLVCKSGALPDSLQAACWSQQAHFYGEQHDLTGARKCAESAFRLYQKTLPQSADVADLHYFLGRMYLLAKMDGEANRQLDKAAAMYKSGPAQSTIGTANCQALRAMRAEQLGDYKQALSLYKSALALLEGAENRDESSFAEVLRGLARVFDHQQELRKSVPLMRRAIVVQERSARSDRRVLAEDFEQLASLYDRLHEGDQARAIRDEAKLKMGHI